MVSEFVPLCSVLIIALICIGFIIFQIDWLQIISDSFKDVNITVDSSQEILVTNKIYFLKLSNLLNTTPNRVVGE